MDERLYIPRSAEQKVVEWLSFFPAVVIIGPRQVGKTSLTQAIRNQVNRASIYLDLERVEDLATVDRLEAFAVANQERLVILDEIQRKPELFPELRSVIDQQRTPGRFILLGSASLALIRDASESLAGRIGILELTGLTITELAGEVSFETHWLRGGFPDSVLAPSDRLSYDWRRSFLRTYLERDLPAFGLDADPATTRRLLTMIGHVCGNLLNVHEFGRNLQLNTRTVQRYLGFLEETFLVRRLAPYFVNVGKRLVKSPKIYLRDSGLLHAILNIREYNQLLGHVVVGASFESFVIEQIAALLGEEVELYFYRTQNGAELDLLLEIGGKIRAVVEIKYSDKPKLTRGFHTALADLGYPPAYVVTPSATADYELAEGVRVLGAGRLGELLPLVN